MKTAAEKLLTGCVYVCINIHTHTHTHTHNNLTEDILSNAVNFILS